MKYRAGFLSLVVGTMFSGSACFADSGCLPLVKTIQRQEKAISIASMALRTRTVKFEATTKKLLAGESDATKALYPLQLAAAQSASIYDQRYNAAYLIEKELTYQGLIKAKYEKIASDTIAEMNARGCADKPKSDPVCRRLLAKLGRAQKLVDTRTRSMAAVQIRLTAAQALLDAAGLDSGQKTAAFDEALVQLSNADLPSQEKLVSDLNKFVEVVNAKRALIDSEMSGFLVKLSTQKESMEALYACFGQVLPD